MARLIPKDLGSYRCSRQVAAFFRTLLKLNDDFTIWLSLATPEKSRPDFFVLYQERFAFLIQVAETSQQLAETAIQSDFLSEHIQLTPDTMASDEVSILSNFTSSLEETFGPLTDSGLSVQRLVVFPDVSRQTIDEISLQRSANHVRFLGLRELPTNQFEERLIALAQTQLPEPALLHLRRAFDPNSVIPASFSPLQLRTKEDPTPISDHLLDIDQEWCVKNDLYLPPEQERLANNITNRTQLISGVAGCGKSLVLLYRALLSAQLHPLSRVLVLTHNRPLRSELERRFHILSESGPNIAWLTFFKWASQTLSAEDWPEDETISPKQGSRILAQLLPQHQKLSTTNPDYLLDEIYWIKDLNIRTKEVYLTTDRTGRGKSINRDALWDLFRDYQAELKSRKIIDWPGVALRFHQAAVQERRLGFPKYDFIFVDEAQFFAKSWFEIVQAALNPGGHLFLAADPTQGFLRRRQSWLSSGIDVRGRTKKLKQPYRNSRAILLFASLFYRARADLAPESHREEDLNIPTHKQLDAIKMVGALPTIISSHSTHNAISRVCQEVRSLRDTGLPAHQVLILHTERINSHTLHDSLTSTLGSHHFVHDAKNDQIPPDAFCQHTTLNAATGLEAPIVIILGIDALFEAEDDPRLSSEERNELLRDHTRQLYMAFTRAGQRLVIICQHPQTTEFLSSLLRTIE